MNTAELVMCNALLDIDRLRDGDGVPSVRTIIDEALRSPQEWIWLDPGHIVVRRYDWERHRVRPLLFVPASRTVPFGWREDMPGMNGLLYAMTPDELLACADAADATFASAYLATAAARRVNVNRVEITNVVEHRECAR